MPTRTKSKPGRLETRITVETAAQIRFLMKAWGGEDYPASQTFVVAQAIQRCWEVEREKKKPRMLS